MQPRLPVSCAHAGFPIFRQAFEFYSAYFAIFVGVHTGLVARFKVSVTISPINVDFFVCFFWPKSVLLGRPIFCCGN